MFHVRLRPDWKGTFRRTIARDEKGKSTAVREFNPGEVVQISAEQLPLLAFDLGKALQPVEWSEEFGKYRPVNLEEVDLAGLIEEIKAGRFKEPEPAAETPQDPPQDPPVKPEEKPAAAPARRGGKKPVDPAPADIGPNQLGVLESQTAATEAVTTEATNAGANAGG